MFTLDFLRNKRILKSDLINNKKIEAFFTTRDLSLKYGERLDLKNEIELNKEFVKNELGAKFLLIPEQTHSDNVEIANFDKLTYPNCDGLITNIKNVAIGLNFADCVPVILCDETNNAVGICHAGWRGTVAHIAQKTVKLLITNFNSSPENITALIGPAIGSSCFEVGDEVLTKITNSGFCQNSIHQNFVDLKNINKNQLLASGVTKIDVCEYCTSCENELFFSYRKENGNTARHSAVVMIRGENLCQP